MIHVYTYMDGCQGSFVDYCSSYSNRHIYCGLELLVEYEDTPIVHDTFSLYTPFTFTSREIGTLGQGDGYLASLLRRLVYS